MPLLIGLVERGQILRIDAHLDDLGHEFGEIRQWQVRFVQEPLLGMTLQVLELQLLLRGDRGEFGGARKELVGFEC